MKAGWREVAAEVPLSGIGKERALFIVEATIRAVGSYAVPVFHKEKLVIFKPKSIAFDTMKQSEFNGLNDAVATVIEQETGIKADDMMKQTESAA